MAHEDYERIGWADVREGDVLLHEDGDRLTVSAVDLVGYRTCKAAGSWSAVASLKGAGFSPYRRKPDLSAVPTPDNPTAYLDKDGVLVVAVPTAMHVDYWMVTDDDSNYWRQPFEMASRAPFTRLVPMPSREQVESLGLYDPDADAVLALMSGEQNEEKKESL